MVLDVLRTVPVCPYVGSFFAASDGVGDVLTG